MSFAARAGRIGITGNGRGNNIADWEENTADEQRRGQKKGDRTCRSDDD